MISVRSILARLCLVCFGVLAPIVAFELALRVASGKPFDLTLRSRQLRAADGNERGPRAQYDQELGWEPNLGRRLLAGKEYNILSGNIRSNGDPRDSRTPRILAVGDSFVFGDDVNDAQTLPAYLEQILNVRVINGGVFGYGLDQIVLRTERLIDRFEPALTIISFIPDDIRRCALSVRENPKPYFNLENGILTLRNVPVPNTSRRSSPAEMDLFRRTLGYSLLADTIMRWMNAPYWLDVPIVLASDSRSKGSLPVDVGKLACALIERVSAMQREGRRFLIVAQYEEFTPNPDHKAAQDVLDCAEKSGLQTLDLYGPLRELQARDPSTYKKFYRQHMTAEGNAFVAQRLADEIRHSNRLLGMASD